MISYHTKKPYKTKRSIFYNFSPVQFTSTISFYIKIFYSGQLTKFVCDSRKSSVYAIGGGAIVSFLLVYFLFSGLGPVHAQTSTGSLFNVTVTPNFIPSFQANKTSIALNVTATNNQNNNKTLTVNILGLTDDMGVRFDNSTIDNLNHTDTFLLTPNATAVKKVVFSAQAGAVSGPRQLTIEVSSGSQVSLFGIDVDIIPNASTCTINCSNVFLNSTFGHVNDPLKVSASEFTKNSTLTIAFGSSNFTGITPITDNSGNALFTITVPHQLGGTYPITVTDSKGNQSSENFILFRSSDIFSTFLSTNSIPPLVQNSTSINTVDVTVISISNKTISANVTLDGLPSGVQAQFDNGPFSQTPSKILSVPAGSNNVTVITFKALDNAPAVSINAFVNVMSGTEVHGQPINTGIISPSSVTTFVPAGGFIGSYDPYISGSVFV
jgi:hypothetical protein